LLYEELIKLQAKPRQKEKKRLESMFDNRGRIAKSEQSEKRILHLLWFPFNKTAMRCLPIILPLG
jgi:hypothetical protein